MGVFDSVYVWSECPYCGRWDKREAQTKDLDCLMSTYEAIPDYGVEKFLKGEKDLLRRSYASEETRAPFEEGSVRVFIVCHSVECQFDGDREWIKRQGAPSGMGRSWQASLLVRKGHFLSKFKNVKLDGYDEKWFASYKKDPEIKKQLDELLKLPENKGQEVIAVHNWRKKEEVKE